MIMAALIASCTYRIHFGKGIKMMSDKEVQRIKRKL